MASLVFTAQPIDDAEYVPQPHLSEDQYSYFAHAKFGYFSHKEETKTRQGPDGVESFQATVKKLGFNPNTNRMFQCNDPGSALTLSEAVALVNAKIDRAIETRSPEQYGLALIVPQGMICVDMDKTLSSATSSDVKTAHFEILRHTKTLVEKSASGIGFHAFYEITDEDRKPIAHVGIKEAQLDIRASGSFVYLTGDYVKGHHRPLAPYADALPQLRELVLAHSSRKRQRSDSEVDWSVSEQYTDAQVSALLAERYSRSSHFLFSEDREPYAEFLIGENKVDRNGKLIDHSNLHYGAVRDLIKVSGNREQVERIYLSSEAGKFRNASSSKAASRNESTYKDWLIRTLDTAAVDLQDEGFPINYERRLVLMQDEYGNEYVEVDDYDDELEFETFDMADADEMPAMSWIVDGVIPAQGVVTIYGSSGAGKSYFTIDLLGAICEQRDWYGIRTRSVPCMYIPLEGRAGTIGRAKAYMIGHPQYRHVRGLQIAKDFDLNLGDGDHVEKLIRRLRRPDMMNGIVCIDTLAQATPGMDENSAEHMGKIMKTLVRVSEAFNGCVIVIHHAGKDVTRGMRGSSAIRASMDEVIAVRNTPMENGPNVHDWYIDKSKDGEISYGSTFTFQPVKVGSSTEFCREGEEAKSIMSSYLIEGRPAEDFGSYDPLENEELTPGAKLIASLNLTEQDDLTFYTILASLPFNEYSANHNSHDGIWHRNSDLLREHWDCKTVKVLIQRAIDAGKLVHFDRFIDEGNSESWLAIQ